MTTNVPPTEGVKPVTPAVDAGHDPLEDTHDPGFTNPLGRGAGFTRSVDIFSRQWGFWIFVMLVVSCVLQVFIFLAINQLDRNNTVREMAPPPMSSSDTPMEQTSPTP